MKKRLLILAFLFIGIGLATAQSRKITGLVIAEDDGLPVIGVNVTVKNAQIGTTTDVNGNFTLPAVPAEASTLVVSYIGMQTAEVPIEAHVEIVLKSNTELLDEVMIVAYGTAKKSQFTGSATIIDTDEINKLQVSNAANALTGKVAGVQLSNSSGQPGATTPSIRIRGISSINAGNDPLIILDGAPYDGDLNNISTQDIESMTVLKDAASNALYGARGANGVIIITTKKGQSGQMNITFDAKWGSNSRATQDYDFVTSPAQYYEMYYGALKNYFVNSQGMSAKDAHLAANENLTASGDFGLGYNVYTVPAGQYMIGENGQLNPHATLGNLVSYNGSQYLLKPDNWLDKVYTNGLRQEYNLSISAGTEKSSYYASINYLKNEGITANSDYERLSGRIKADYQLTDWLKTGTNISYTHFDANSLNEDGDSGSSNNVFAYVTRIAPIYPLYIRDGQGNILTDKNGITRYDYGNKDNAGLTRPVMSGSNAYSANLLDKNNAEGNAWTANAFLDIRFLKDFKFTWTSGVSMTENRQTQFTNPYYGQYASSNGITSISHTRNLSYNHQQLLNYRKEFGSHNLEVMLGHESYRSKNYLLMASRSNVFNLNNTELSGAITDNSGNSYTTDYNTEGYFGRVQYDWQGKYFASASYRRDASSRFHPDHRWGNFWSAGVAWILSKEEWFDMPWFDMLKVKASYGSQGNDNIGDFRFVNTYTIANSNGHIAAVPSTMGNENITWETNGNFNAGIDFELWKGKLKGTVEYFYRKTTDMLFSFPLPPTMGYTSYYANVGDMRNQGVEAEFNANAIRTRDFTWDIHLNLTHYKNKIIYLPDERKTMTTDGVPGYSNSNYYYGEGLPLYTYRIPKYAGVNENGESMYYKDVKDDQGRLLGRAKTTDYSEADYYLCGTALPDVYGGFGTSFKYKGFDLSVDFTYQIGGQVYDSDYAAMMSSPTKSSKGFNFHADLLKAWSLDNLTSQIPRLQYGDEFTAAISDRFLTNASYLNLQNINVGYTLPKQLIRRTGISKVRVYVTADNVWLWSKRQGLDPRQSITGEVTSAYYAPIRTISGGLTINF